MEYRVVYMDLFDVPDHFYLTHCVSSDYKLGAGIAVDFERLFDLKRQLNEIGDHTYPDCILVGRVFNLVTKKLYYMKPTYKTLAASLLLMKTQVLENGITHLAMATIGCNLDKLDWDTVSKLIQTVFADTDITIQICIDKMPKRKINW
jgi:hypothetical protein